jgi:hypothetical protein
MVKADVDNAIRQSMTERQFFSRLREAGYKIKIGKDISIRPPGKERFVRLERNFGENYSISGIRKRLLSRQYPEQRAKIPRQPQKKSRAAIHERPAKKLTGFRALYFYYLYRMGALPKKRRAASKEAYFLFREDIRFIQNISKETRLLVSHGIDTAGQLKAYKTGLNEKITEMSTARKTLRLKMKKTEGADKLAEMKSETARLSEAIGGLRKELKLCDDIEKRSTFMKDKIERARKEEKPQRKELTKDEQFR